MYNTLIFDLDGTLLNTDLLIKKSFIHTFKKYKPDYTLSEEELLSFLGPSFKNTFSRYVEADQIDELIQKNVTTVVTSNPQLIDFKQLKSSGDAFLIATAMKYSLTVITEENKDSSKKIPYVCKNLGVPCVNILELCELEQWTF